jgi:hypothetical protein
MDLVERVRALLAPFPDRRITRRSFYMNGFSQADLVTLTKGGYVAYDAQYVVWIGDE